MYVCIISQKDDDSDDKDDGDDEDVSEADQGHGGSDERKELNESANCGRSPNCRVSSIAGSWWVSALQVTQRLSGLKNVGFTLERAVDPIRRIGLQSKCGKSESFTSSAS